MRVALSTSAASARPAPGRRAGGSGAKSGAAIAPLATPPIPSSARHAAVPTLRRTLSPLRAAAETPAASAEKPAAVNDPAVRAAIATVRAAAAGPDRPAPAHLLASILALERAKLPPAPFFEALTGGGGAAASAGGRRWRLTFTAGASAVKAAMKGEAPGLWGGGAGAYVLLTAVQRWAADAGAGASPSSQTGAIENGVFLGWLGALAFRGKFSLDGRRLPFTLDTLRLRLGPKWFEFPFKAGAVGPDGKPSASGPFFLVAYADDGVVVARGRSGGLALWARAGDEWSARAGVDA